MGEREREEEGRGDEEEVKEWRGTR